jgi:hypothetical protein
VLFFFLEKKEPKIQDGKIAPHKLHGTVFRHCQRALSRFYFHKGKQAL